MTNWSLPIVDLRSLAVGARDQEARRLTVEAARARFDLATYPLLRTELLRLDDDDYVPTAVTLRAIAIPIFSFAKKRGIQIPTPNPLAHCLEPLGPIGVRERKISIGQRQRAGYALLLSQRVHRG